VGSLSCFDGSLSIREEFPTKRAYGAVASPGAAVFAAVEDDLEMQFVPALLWKGALQIFLGLHYVFAIGQFPALSETMNMSVDGESWNSKGLAHDDRGGLMPDPWQRFKSFHIVRDGAVVFRDQNFRELRNSD
jgi:hypothetical protein